MLDLKLRGKTAIVTGGSADIGLACAEALSAERVNVVITSRDTANWSRLLRRFSAWGAANNWGQ
jgi:NAD(P)-dependent dehydrogenase (short-subunit alcohol dehydrogenase family)